MAVLLRDARSVTRIRIALIEDNRLLRDSLADVIARHDDLEIASAAADDKTVLELLDARRPSVILIDLQNRTRSARRLLPLLKKCSPDVRVILMNMTEQDDVLDLVRAGASGFVLEDAALDELLETIRAVAGGCDVLPSPLTAPLFAQIAWNAQDDVKAAAAKSVRLTPREREIVQLVTAGLSNKEIAQHLNIATYTVKTHVHNLLEKLAVHKRVQLAPFCVPDRTGVSNQQSH